MINLGQYTLKIRYPITRGVPRAKKLGWGRRCFRRFLKNVSNIDQKDWRGGGIPVVGTPLPITVPQIMRKYGRFAAVYDKVTLKIRITGPNFNKCSFHCFN